MEHLLSFTVVVTALILELMVLSTVTPGSMKTFSVTTTTVQENIVRTGIALA